MRVHILDSRRVPGASVYAREPGAVLELELRDYALEAPPLFEAWRDALASVLPWTATYLLNPRLGGATFFVTGPVEALMPLTDLSDWALSVAESRIGRTQELAPAPPQDHLDALTAAIVPGLDALVAAARARAIPLLVDEDRITLGAGAKLLDLPRQGPVPAPEAVDWTAVASIPVGVVTGTNGKTTTTRLVARMAREAGLVAGSTSSDGVVIDGVVVQAGDFSGPEGARMVLRDPRVQIAILETARGGILRRGVVVERPDAAVITNVTEDHVGDGGISDLAELARVKAVAVRDAKLAILNADDPVSSTQLPALIAAPTEWCSASRRPHAAWILHEGEIARVEGGQVRTLVPVEEMPITFGGHAHYNIENALAAAALATGLGIPEAAIVRALRTFTSSASDNPGRGNLARIGEVAVMLDFAHNPAAIRSVIGFAKTLLADHAGGLHVSIAMPGDRTDVDVTAVAAAIAAGAPASVIVREMPASLLRGRPPGEMPALIAGHLARAGVHADAISIVATESAAVVLALSGAQPGDLVLVLTHVDPAVDQLLVARGATFA